MQPASNAAAELYKPEKYRALTFYLRDPFKKRLNLSRLAVKQALHEFASIFKFKLFLHRIHIHNMKTLGRQFIKKYKCTKCIPKNPRI